MDLFRDAARVLIIGLAGVGVLYLSQLMGVVGYLAPSDYDGGAPTTTVRR